MRFEQAVLQAAIERQQADEAQMESEVLAPRPQGQALLWRLLEQGPRFRRYDGEALRFCRERVTGRVTPQMAQHALESQRERTPALAWKSARGDYAVDDAAMHRWFEQRTSVRRWPPADPQVQLGMDDGAEANERIGASLTVFWTRGASAAHGSVRSARAYLEAPGKALWQAAQGEAGAISRQAAFKSASRRPAHVQESFHVPRDVHHERDFPCGWRPMSIDFCQFLYTSDPKPQ
ncbi:MAG: hypothetical protein U5L05_11335 [Rubrivivax sp.]|nr:hypothetical protein [Rubrivivax sp.]